MKKQTYLHIQEPCHENWNRMTAADKGRFCLVCTKTVTDFSNMTDAEILAHLAKVTSPTCGRFAPDQLDRALRPPATPVKKTIWTYLLSLCLPLMSSTRMTAQKATTETSQQVPVKPAKPEWPLAAPAVEIADTGRLTKADTSVHSEALDADLPVKPAVMGLIIAYDKVGTRDTIAAVADKLAGKEMFRIERVAAKEKRLHLRISNPGEYVFQLLDRSSKLLIHRNIKVQKQRELVVFDLPAGTAPGNYYLKISDDRSKEKYVESFHLE
ncbi:MAG TPA: hypothetical protein VF145_01650 [Chitinophagaceae bacterium]